MPPRRPQRGTMHRHQTGRIGEFEDSDSMHRNRWFSTARTFAALWLAFFAAWLAVAAASKAIERPNVILIVIDDLGWADLSCYGSKLHLTPRLDGMAAGGIRFTQAYAACPVCSPTRAAIMTGK